MSRPAGRPYGEPPDADVVRLLRAGDASAVDQLYRQLAGPAFGLARRVLADDVRAEQAVRSAFVELWRDPGVVSALRTDVTAALLALVHQNAVGALRAGSAHRSPTPAPTRGGSRPPGAHRAQAADEHAADDEQGTVADRVRLAMALLPSTQRQALTLAYFGGYTQREVAALTGVPLSTVRTRMLAGMRRLQEELPDAGGRIPGGARDAAAAEGRGR